VPDPSERFGRTQAILEVASERLDRISERLDRTSERLDRTSERLDRIAQETASFQHALRIAIMANQTQIAENAKLIDQLTREFEAYLRRLPSP